MRIINSFVLGLVAVANVSFVTGVAIPQPKTTTIQRRGLIPEGLEPWVELIEFAYGLYKDAQVDDKLENLQNSLDHISEQLKTIDNHLNEITIDIEMGGSNTALSKLSATFNILKDFTAGQDTNTFNQEEYQKDLLRFVDDIQDTTNGVYALATQIYEDFVNGQADVGSTPLIKQVWLNQRGKLYEALNLYNNYKNFNLKFQNGLSIAYGTLLLAADVEEGQQPRSSSSTIARRQNVGSPNSLRANAADIKKWIDEWDQLFAEQMPKEYTDFIYTLLAGYDANANVWTAGPWAWKDHDGTRNFYGSCTDNKGAAVANSRNTETLWWLYRYGDRKYVIHTEANDCHPFGDLYAITDIPKVRFVPDASLSDSPANFEIIPSDTLEAKGFTMIMYQGSHTEKSLFGRWALGLNPDQGYTISPFPKGEDQFEDVSKDTDADPLYQFQWIPQNPPSVPTTF